ncbi:MAG TPA: choice-of-anchor tandem repeat GloVer-containing protein [Rhizomicrobium sp.]|nr:choice-of-anchor tandem repeat GloVer-containing protein [Rhizomicrobium sp.]
MSRANLVMVSFSAGALLCGSDAEAWTLKTLYSFCSENGCTDGTAPAAGLLQDASGNLYGTTEAGGAYNDGVVFALIPNGRKWKYKVLHSFCYSCGDGTNPVASLIIDTNGNLYGTTGQSGPTGCGTAFRLSPNADRSKWKEKTLYAASCAPSGNSVLTGLTYVGAASGAPYDGTSPLYGTTNSGGTGYGTIYRIMPKGTKWKETDLYAFCPEAGSGCVDGENPGALILDAKGNLYGNTLYGGSAGAGTAYQLVPNADRTKWTEHIIYNFCSAASCTDGANPEGALVMNGAGDLFGTVTAAAGESGGVYELAERRKIWGETLLCTFLTGKCGEGYFPQAGVIVDASGNLYGTNSAGGSGLEGTVFEWNGSAVKTLYNFCTAANCADGALPIAPLLMDGSGNLYGTAVEGGSGNNGGTVFELKR